MNAYLFSYIYRDKTCSIRIHAFTWEEADQLADALAKEWNIASYSLAEDE